MKKILLTLTCFVVLCVYSTTLVVHGSPSSELPILQWDKTYGGTYEDVAWSVIQTNDAGYAIAGWTASFGAGYYDFWVIKTDENGQMQWNRTYGGSSSGWFGERAHCIIQTSDGGFAIVGETSSFGAGSRDFWLVKTDASGNMEWNQTYGGTNQDEPYSLIQTNDGGYAMAGRTLSFGVAGSGNMWLVKTDAHGTMEWNKAYGGTGIEIAYSVIQTDDGGYAIGGETGSRSEERDMWLVKTNSTGDIQWQKTYGLAGSIFESSTSLTHTTDGGYALAGFREMVGADSNFYLVKTDEDGNMQWDMTYGGATREVASDAIQTSDGGYMLTGAANLLGSPDLWLVKTDASGNMEWNQTYGGVGSEWAHSVVQISDRQYVVAGHTTSFGVGSADFWLIKLAPEKHYLVVQTEPMGLADILGEGWHDEGTKVELTAPSFVPSEVGENGVRYRFDYWIVDGNILLANPMTVQMDANHTATAHYVKQYCLTVISLYGAHGGEGWYDAGETAYATVTPLTVTGPEDVRHVFAYWSEDASGTTSPSNPITMDSPKTATANWKTQYLLTVTSPYDTPSGGGWYDAGDTAYATLADGFAMPNIGFIGWSGHASGWDLISDLITMDAPKTAIANWEAGVAYGDVRTIGFWKHQVNVWYFTELKNSGMNIRGIGTAQISEEALITYLAFIDSNSGYFSGKIVGPTNLDTLRRAYNILKTPTGPESMKMRAEQQLFATWLNLAHNTFFWNTQLSQDTLYIYWQHTYDENNGLATISEAILFCEAELLKPDGNYEVTKNICDNINNNLGIIWGT